jgi:hypothetical protein
MQDAVEMDRLEQNRIQTHTNLLAAMEKETEEAERLSRQIEEQNQQYIDQVNLIINVLGTTLSQLSQLRMDQIKSERDAEIESLEATLKAQLDAGTISKEEYKKRLDEGEEAWAAKLTEQARVEKALRLFMAAINIPSAIIRGYADAGVVGAIIAGVAGAVNLGVIAAQPLPTFAQGGIAFGPSMFGEAGPEAAIPLTDDVLGRLGDAINESSSGGGGGRLTVVFGNSIFADIMQANFNNQTVYVPERSVVSV